MNGQSKYEKEGKRFLKTLQDAIAGAKAEDSATDDAELSRKLRATIKELQQCADAVEKYMQFGTWFIFGPGPGPNGPGRSPGRTPGRGPGR